MAGESENKNKNDMTNNNQADKQHQHLPSPSSHRLFLPTKMIDRSQISIWSILKQFIGKELSKIAMPAALCEPLSFLQRITENVYYSELLNKACMQIDPCKRMEYVAAFAITNISSNIDRLSKPFNPLLGETYELVREDLGFRFIAEQVSHHPPVSAFHTDSTNENLKWKFYGSVNPKIKFWGKSIEVQPKGGLTLELNKFNEVYTWQTVTCCVHNIIVGKLWFEYYGTMEITCHQTGYKAVINFKPYSWSNKELNKVEGFIYDKKKNKVRALYGYWTHCMYSCDPDVYDKYVKSNKQLPMVQLDSFFNEVNHTSGTHKQSTSNENNLSGLSSHNHSETDLLHLDKSHSNEEKTKFTLHENDIEIQMSNGTKNGSIENGNNNSTSQPPPTPTTTTTAHRLSKNPISSPAFPVTNTQNPFVDVFELWRVVPRPPYNVEYYSFNYFTMTLNELKDEFKNIIAPTDSRFRTDIRQLELGDLDKASIEKNRLEEKQRESRKNRKEEYKSKWFELAKHPYLSGEELWLFNNRYWLREYSDCPQLY